MNGIPNSFPIEFALILALILANGIFSMSEMAVVSSRKVRLQQRAEDGDHKARAALHLAAEPTRFLSTVQIGITLISTLTGALGGASLAAGLEMVLRRAFPILDGYTGPIALVIVVVVITYLSLVLGELVPKRVALANPERIAAGIASPMAFLSRITGPVVHLLSISTDGVLRLLQIKKPDDLPVTPEEITVLMQQGEQVGVFEEKETDIVESVFRLSDLYVDALMTPRMDIDWVDLDEPLDGIVRRVMDSPHNHFPVARGRLDNVTGILRGKDLLARLTDGAQFEVENLVQPAMFVPESLPAFQALDQLREGYGNLALVIDEFGGVLGMVTLFDVMEAIVGGISERGEPVQPEAVQREDGSWLVEGMMRIDEFKELLDLDHLPEEDRAGYQTVGGFIMAQLGDVPQAGDHFECCGWRFEVVDMDGMRVDKVLTTREQ